MISLSIRFFHVFFYKYYNNLYYLLKYSDLLKQDEKNSKIQALSCLSVILQVNKFRNYLKAIILLN
jgi:hypothetical protein